MPKQILVVDKNPSVQKLMEFTLNREGFQVLCFMDGLSALDSALKTPPALFVVDSQLEGMSLNYFLEKIQQRDTLRQVPVILMLNTGEQYDSAKIRDLGTADSIKKPLDPIELVEKIKTQGSKAGRDPVSVVPQTSEVAPHVEPPQEIREPHEPEDEMIKIEELLGWSSPLEETSSSEGQDPQDQTESGDHLDFEISSPERKEGSGLNMDEPIDEMLLFEEELRASVPDSDEAPARDASPEGISSPTLSSDSQPPLRIEDEELQDSFSDQKEHQLSEASVAAVSSPTLSDEVKTPARPAMASAFPKEPHEGDPLSPSSSELTDRQPQRLPNLHGVEEMARHVVEETVHKIIQEVVEKVAWEVIPSLAEITIKREVGQLANHASSEGAPVETPPGSRFTEDMTRQAADEVARKTAQDVVEKVAWEVVPSLAEAAIKKEIERLTAET